MENSLPLLSDKRWRIANLYQVLNEEAKIVPFVLRSEQIEFLDNRKNRNFILKARKLGMSTLLAIDALDDCIFNPKFQAAIVDRTQVEAQGKLAMAKLAWDWLDKHPDPKIAVIGATIKYRLQLTTDAAGELGWSNGSSFEAGVSLRGGTPQRLHVSELGYIASHDRKRAEEIKSGSINAVPKSGQVTIETTHEGGKSGLSYELAKLAMDDTARGVQSPLEWQFFFFPWYEHPSYTLAGRKPQQAATHEYFKDVQRDAGIVIPPERQAWYEATRRVQKEAIFREFPTTPDEAFRAIVTGAIYPHMMTLRATGRIKAFEHERSAPMFACWDLGVSDFTSIWLMQVVGREILWLDWFEGEGQGIGSYVEVIRSWEQKYDKMVATHFLPHDADTRERGSGKSCVQHLAEAGISRIAIKVVPRTPDVWQGIRVLRDLLPNSVFHARCDEPRRDETGQERRSGVGCLEGYHSLPNTAAGIIREVPAHDDCSHTADAARTFAEAWDRGMIGNMAARAPHGMRPKPKVISGYRGIR